MDPLSIIASTIAIIEAISTTYKAIQHLRGLPNEFKEVNRNLPLAQHTLRLARDHLHGLVLDESAKKAMEPVISSCEQKARMLSKIFERVEIAAKDSRDGSVLELYRTCLLRLGKAHRVESLMQDILGGLDILASNQSFKAAAQVQIQLDQLKEAIGNLSKVESCVPDSDFDCGTNTQYIASGGTGYQSNIDGQDHKINSGSGRQYVAQTMHFAQPNTRGGFMQILQTLHASPYLEGKNRNPDRVPGTCEWFAHHASFQTWRESTTSSLLWVSADPGCGKSVLAKYLVESELQTTNSRTTCYFFFKDDFEDQKSANVALSCILHQLFTQRDGLISDKIHQRLKANQSHLTSSFDELWEILMMALQENWYGELVCVLDAFDECAHQRDKLSQALDRFYDSASNLNLKFLITTRPYAIIKAGIHPRHISSLPVIHLEGESEKESVKIAEEIRIYIKDRVLRIQKTMRLDPDEAQLLSEELLKVPNGTYLWVYLTLQFIEDNFDLSINKAQIRKISSSLPRTVDDAYQKILSKSSDPGKAKKLLQIVVAAARPLTLGEMRLALALERHHTSEKDALQDVPPLNRFRLYMRDLCGLFVTITDSKVYLLHQTAKEFLVSGDSMVSPKGRDDQIVWKHSLKLIESHRILCRISIWHLLLPGFSTDCPDEQLNEAVLSSDFLDYSAMNWAIHFRASSFGDDTIMESVRKMCTAEKTPTWFNVYWLRTYEELPRDFTTVMIAAYFGIDKIVELLLKDPHVEVDSMDGIHGRTALSWASGNGYHVIVKRLTQKFRFVRYTIRRGSIVDARDNRGRTPLVYAAWNGHTAVVKRLCQSGASVDTEDDIRGTPMSYALYSRHESVVQQLMKEAKGKSATNNERQLLVSAILNSDHKAVKWLLDYGVHPHFMERKFTLRGLGTECMTPLSYAVGRDLVTIARLLLDHGAEVNHSHLDNLTPLVFAIDQQASVETVELLLKKDAQVNFQYITPVSISRVTSVELLADEDGTYQGRSKPTVSGQTRFHLQWILLIGTVESLR